MQGVKIALVRSRFAVVRPPRRGVFAACLPSWLAAIIILLGCLSGSISLAETPNTTDAADITNTNVLKGLESAVSGKPEVLQVNDVIAVQVFQEPDLDTKAIIDKDGMVTFPLLGPVKIGLLTAKEANERVRQLYEQDYLVDPQVTLVVVERAKRRFTVMGQVQRPGTYDMPPAETVNLLTAIAMAGGYSRLAAPSKVTLQRVQDGKMSVINLDAERMARDKKAKPYELMPDDIIAVGERVF